MFAPNKAGSRTREVVDGGRQRSQRWKRLAACEFVQGLRLIEITELKPAQRPQRDVVGQKCPGCGGNQDLPAVCRPDYARRLVYREGHVVAIPRDGQTGVEAHSNTHARCFRPRVLGQVPLCSAARRDRVGGRFERGEDGIPLRLYDYAAVARDRGTDDLVVRREQRWIDILELPKQAGLALDVGEEKGDRS